VKKIAVAITGASGALYARLLLDRLQQYGDQISEVSLVWSDTAKIVWAQELGDQAYDGYPFKVWNKHDFMAPFASGSSSYTALIICPCSMGTLGRIAYNLIHLRNMTTVTEAGGIICPATPSFYSQPATLEAAVDTVVQRVLQLCGIETNGYKWGEQEG